VEGLVNCGKPDWLKLAESSERLAEYYQRKAEAHRVTALEARRNHFKEHGTNA
jgi:hypothetical protein